MDVSIRAARQSDVATLHALIRALAEYEKLAAQVVGTAEDLQRELFSERPVIEAVYRFGGRARARLCAVLSQLFDVSCPPRPVSRRSFRRARGARPRHRQGADSALRARCGSTSVADDSSGRCSTGISRRSTSISRSGRRCCPTGRICRLSGDALQRFARAADAPATSQP